VKYRVLECVWVIYALVSGEGEYRPVYNSYASVVLMVKSIKILFYSMSSFYYENLWWFKWVSYFDKMCWLM